MLLSLLGLDGGKLVKLLLSVIVILIILSHLNFHLLDFSQKRNAHKHTFHLFSFFYF